MDKAKTLARRLLKQNRGTRSHAPRPWRVIAREDYANKIPAGTLARFALADGGWLPSVEHQITLGLKHQRKAKPQQPKDLFDMATNTLRDALINRQPAPEVDPRIVREFKHLGWLQPVRTR